MTTGRWFLLKQVDRIELVIRQQHHLSLTENQGTCFALSWSDIWLLQAHDFCAKNQPNNFASR